MKKYGGYYITLGGGYIDINIIHNQDCIDGMKEKIPDNSIDLIVTSPPYNFDMQYNNYEDKRDWQEYFRKIKEVWEECYRVLKQDGRIVVNIQPLFSEYIPSHHIISKQLIDIGFNWKGEILWEKNNYNCKYTAWGSWKSPSSPYLKYTWEFIEVYCKDKYKKNGDKENVDIKGDEFKEWVYAKWNIAPEKNMKEYNHPAMFPEKLVERVLKLFSFQNDIILDPFNGAGTTTYVAEKLNRKWIGFDISKEYVDIAYKRVGKLAKKYYEELPEEKIPKQAQLF